ncbi:acyl-CoA dehydrogenase [Palleronia sp. LCG004]|uniref:acyl-CoA dehydrogenase n=1 Tax=Palleronia sp. LCG004 TaxID=3079304 RepID=UPI002942F91A|nr:acyl-CoA dehydrogenase [Palleronia sp. LCG004]WOI55467.1 acyl-CoA dehydrogenase [Palleronia sp. LCG004]
MPYRAPVEEYRFLLRHVVGLDEVTATDRFSEATDETVRAILLEAGRICEEVLSPLQRVGDTHPARLENGIVRTSPGFAEGYRAIAEGGWVGMSADPQYGGLGLPLSVTSAVNEMMASACLALQLNPLMTQGQIEALEHHASDEIKSLYLPKLASGEWCGTMNLTEPQAGSDVGALTTRAEARGDGTYAITGQKIYISWADNDFSANVCHLVLARLPGGAEGTRGISLFLVPKYLPDADGNPGRVNELRVLSLEHKLGLHGSPTAVMEYEGATGWMIGEDHGGMAAMFTMMNNARLGVGGQGIGAAEGAYQHALAHAMDRRQGKAGGSGAIVEHPDVRRMLTTMKAEIHAARAIALANAKAIDMANATGAPDWVARAAFLTPITKAFGTETGIFVATEGIQVHGGMGVIEETGAAQYSRDVRVTSIYEGTNGIQAVDLVGRKLKDGGETATRLVSEILAETDACAGEMPDLAQTVREAAEMLEQTTKWLVGQDMSDRLPGAVAYLRAFARILGAHYHLRSARNGNDARRALARFYIERMLPEHAGLQVQVRRGGDGLFDLTLDDLAAA